MKNKYFIFFLVLAGIAIIGSCKEDFLTVKPAGALDQNILAIDAGVEAMLIGAYAVLDGQGRAVAAGDLLPLTGYMDQSEVWKQIKELMPVTSLISILFRDSMRQPQMVT